MSVPAAPARRRWRLPRRTVRLKLTMVYGALFLVSGAVLLAVTYFLVAQKLPAVATTTAKGQSGVGGFTGVVPGSDGGVTGAGATWMATCAAAEDRLPSDALYVKLSAPT